MRIAAKSQAPQVLWVRARLVASACIVALGLWIAGDAAWAQWRNHRALGWPSVPGVVVDSTLRVRHGNRGATYYTPWVTYRYAVAGVAHAGHCIVFGAANTDRRRAEALVAHYRAGTPTRVYLDPRDADSSLLEPGPIPGQGYVFGAGSLLIGLGVLMVVPVLRRNAPRAARSHR